MTGDEVRRRYDVLRRTMAEHSVDAVVVAGSEYTGFEGGVLWTSGFRIVHRYAYVLVPSEGDPVGVFPGEARWVGVHGEGWLEHREFPERCGAWMREHAEQRGWSRVGVYGLGYVMPVTDYRDLAEGTFEIVDFDRAFDRARSVKSDEELRAVRDSLDLNEEGFWAVVEEYEPGLTEAQIMAPAEALFVAGGTGRRTMNMVLSGRNGTAEPEFRIPDHTRPVEPDDLLLYSLEIAGPQGYWTEFARPLIRGSLDRETSRMLEAYEEAFEEAQRTLRAGLTAHDVHRAVSAPFTDRGYPLGHVTGHSIGTTMIEHPRVGEGEETELAENMVISIHPHVVTEDERRCLYMQETFRVGADRGEPLSSVPIRIFDGTER